MLKLYGCWIGNILTMSVSKINIDIHFSGVYANLLEELI